MRPAPLFAAALAGCAHAPTYLQHTSGLRGDRESALGWTLLAIGSLVVIIVAVLVVAAIVRAREGGELARTRGGLRWIIIGGVVVPAAILIQVLIQGMTALAAVSRAPAPPALTIQVTGHRWWWEVRYPGGAASDLAITANEIHIPVGRPVRIELAAGDVIHSFWIPQLGGKTDLIPGQDNVTWLEADSAGIYWGSCAEYCGAEHARMGLMVVAEPAATFERWLSGQRRLAPDPTDPAALKGRDLFERSACALCHSVRGTRAGGAVGPDLTHVASRRSIAAGLLPNNRGTLTGWIADPQRLKPGVVMPAVRLSPEQLTALVGYLETLR